MSKQCLKFHNVTFIYDCASKPLFQNVSLHVASGWTGVIGANGAGKTTLLKLATGLLEPVQGTIDLRQNSVYCPQRTDDIPAKFNELILTNTKFACVIKGQLGIRDDWGQRWKTLSHGERKRAQIAVALWLKPDVFAIDEPTNHLDSQARQVVANALHLFDGIGLLVSHDRELLDSLCQQCLFIVPPEVITRPGGITKAMEIAKTERQSLEKQHMLKKRAYRRLQREVAKRGELAKQSQKRRSKRGLAKKDHDGREKKDRARVSGKDGVGGKLQRQLQGRLAQDRRHLEDVAVKKQHTLGIWLPGSVSKRNFLLELGPGAISLGGQKQLTYPQLVIRPEDSIAVTGANGSGKSTLIRYIVNSLNVPKERITYVPQEIDMRQSQDILAQVHALPNHKLGHLMTIISRLGSRPYRLLDSTEPSPGETRKLLLATGMTYAPHIIIMDEPTNHMDLPSIECLGQALSDCPCSLVLVSHDRRFLNKLTQKRWDIVERSCSSEGFVLHKCNG
ncbi:MAG: ABC-F family ATP-binding cassette domain-containing protein [Desulfobacteraceae bacterium]|nr:ABC-F family ATP-binding cassette domain-containing protein [Desulfobacteraceae bacterium]